MYPPRITVERARDLRRRMTRPEVRLWQALRGRKLGGARFRRQHPVGPWILDFYCKVARLAVEVDGDGHNHPDRMERDARRTEWLARAGIGVHRIPAREVLGNLEEVLLAIRRRVGDRPPPPLRGPPPPMGED